MTRNDEREPYALYTPPPPEPGEDIAAYLAKHADTYRSMDELGYCVAYDPRPPEQRYTKPPYSPTVEDWLANYTFIVEPPTTIAGQVAIADAAPGAFLKDTGREPPHDLVARVLAELRRHYPPR